MNNPLNTLGNGIIKNNPVFVLLLGMCPSLATTSNVLNAVGMGSCACLVLIFSNIIISFLRSFIPKQIRIASYIVIIAGFVSLVDLLLKTFFPSLSESLGIFIPLIVVNCIILARAESFASKNNWALSALDGFSNGIGFSLAIILLAAFREILGAGTFAGMPLFGGFFQPLSFFILPPGGFLSLGILLAIVFSIKNKLAKKRSLS